MPPFACSLSKMAFTTRLLPLFSALYLLGILHLLFCCPSEGTTSGFTTHLIHRDSPLSPFYNPSSTHFDRLHDAFQRSLKRVNHLTSAVQATARPGGGEYLMKITIGTPPVEVIGVADTGSDLTWTQCLPCKKCYHQPTPLFNPSHSSSYRILKCPSEFCKSAFKDLSCDKNLTCEYDFIYGDDSHSIGNLAFETFTLGTSKSVSLPNIAFGCGHDTTGFSGSGSGIIGLGSGKLSLISQMGQPFGKKFSYCLNPPSINSTSKISFGKDALVSGSGVVTIPIITKSPHTLYYITLEAISVGTKRIPFPPNKVVEGNFILDSGTTYTWLPIEVFEELVSTLNRVIKLPKAKDPHGILQCCYKKRVGDKHKLPNMRVHFKDGDVVLKPVSTFTWVKEDVVCLAMVANPEYSIYGNIAQADFVIGFDLEAATVSFKPTDCTKY